MKTDTYRRLGSSLFKYYKQHNAYIHVYRNDALKTLAALIYAYEEETIWEDL